MPNEVITCLMIFQEILVHMNHSPTSSYFTLNDSVKNIISTFGRLDLPSHLPYLILFIQHKFGNSPKLNEFLHNKEIPLLIKLIYILKHAHQEELIALLDTLEAIYIEKGLLEGLILTGNSRKSIQLLQNYLDISDDLLVCVILTKFFVDSKDNFYSKCEGELFDTLNRMKMFNERIHFNQKLNEIVLHMEKGFKMIAQDKKSGQPASIYTSAEFILNCFYCNAKISADKADQFRNLPVHNKEGNEIVKILLLNIN